jgi:hypothetical protein
MARGARVGVIGVGAAAAILLVGSAVSSDSSSSATEQQRAEQLVQSVHEAGLAPRLTVGVAESLYGDDAPAVCDVFQDGLTTAEENLLLGNPAHGRRKTITNDAIAYGRIVVTTYCPDNLADYDQAVDDLDPFEKTDR